MSVSVLAGCNVLLIQKSILRDAVSDLALHFLSKMKIMVVKDVEREEIEFICKVREGQDGEFSIWAGQGGGNDATFQGADGVAAGGVCFLVG